MTPYYFFMLYEKNGLKITGSLQTHCAEDYPTIEELDAARTWAVGAFMQRQNEEILEKDIQITFFHRLSK